MIFESLMLLALALAFIAIQMNDLLQSVIVLAGLDLVVAVMFYMMNAPDIALTQAAVCAGLMTFFLAVTIHKTERFER